MMVLPSTFIASLGELVAGAPFRDLISFHMPRSSMSLMAEVIISSHCSAFDSCLAFLTSVQAASHSLRLVAMRFRRSLRFLIKALSLGDMRGLSRFLGLTFLTCLRAESSMAWVKASALFLRELWVEGFCRIFSTSLRYLDQSIPLLRQRGALPVMGWCETLA